MEQRLGPVWIPAANIFSTRDIHRFIPDENGKCVICVADGFDRSAEHQIHFTDADFHRTPFCTEWCGKSDFFDWLHTPKCDNDNEADE